MTASAPKASAAGPTTANERGTPASVIIQSKLVTRPSMSVGTSRCSSVNQITRRTPIEPSATNETIIACQTSVTIPNPAVMNMPSAQEA
jgi:hypothetical protein